MVHLRSGLLVVGACLLLLWTGPAVVAADGKVKGTVRVAGKALAAGRVFFHLKNGQFVGSKVKGGVFTVDRVPAGMPLLITVEGKGVAPKYTTEATTPLRFIAKQGANTYYIRLR